MTEWRPDTLVKKFSSVNSIERVFQTKTPTVASIQRDYGEAFTIDYISIWLIRLNKRLNSVNKMTSEQIKIISEDVLLEYYQLTIADINLIFQRAKKEKLYNRLDPFIVLEWFDSYFNERCEAGARASEGEYQKDTNENTRTKRPVMVYLTKKEINQTN